MTRDVLPQEAGLPRFIDADLIAAGLSPFAPEAAAIQAGRVMADRPFLLGDRFTAADLLLHSPYAFFGKPGVPAIDAWVDRCTARPGAAFAMAFDRAHPVG